MELMGWMTDSGNDYNRIASGLLLGYCILLIFFKRKINVALSFRIVIIFLFFFFVVSSGIAIRTFVLNDMPLNGILVVLLRYFIEIVLAIFILNFVQNQKDLDNLFSFFFKPALFFFVVFSMLQITTSSYGDVQGVDRIMGPFGSPSTLAGFLHLFIALTFYYYKDNHSYLFWVICVVQYTLLLFTGSVATIFASLLLLFLIGYRQQWIKQMSFYRVLPLAIVIIVIGVFIKLDSIITRLSVIVNLENFQLTEGSSLRWRWDAWIAYLSLLGKDIGNWIFGLGVGTQRFILHPDYPNSLWRLFDAPGTHNDFLAVLIDFGLLGVGLFVGGIVLLFRVIKHAERRDESLYFIRYYLITVLFIMLSENYIDQLIMFVFVVFLMAIIRAKDEIASSDDKLFLQT
jgi:hypothetical protein